MVDKLQNVTFTIIEDAVVDCSKKLTDELQTAYSTSMHSLLDKIIDQSKEWDKELNIIPDKLIIRTPYEYLLIKHFRESNELNSHVFMKGLVDELIIKKDKIFDSRNDNKINIVDKLKQTEPIPVASTSTSKKVARPVLKQTKKHFWSKK